ncbi:acyl carrier protein [Ruminococcus sp. HUN007]|uniref:acyl carrier protein n=1 Tax=Ruminococcus sp. HUN007 TaxID=1514668 RepID=UPI0005D1E6F4|nr:acyl carrier protein [Ruminococcus sp. HUN007]
MNNISWDEFTKEVSDYVGVDASEITKDTDIYEDLCLDSLGVFGLGTQLTETFGLTVALSSVAVVSKIGDMYDILNEKGVKNA